MATKKLTEAGQRAVVQWLAMGLSSAQIANLCKEHFGVALTRQAIGYYDPASVAGSGLSEELRALFVETRERFFQAVDLIPIRHLAIRLHRLEDLYQREIDRGNLEAAARRLEDAAKEVGGLHTNRREVTGRDGEPFGVVVRVPAELPPEQWAAEVEREHARKVAAHVSDRTGGGADNGHAS